MDVIVQRQCALDVHKAQVTACVRIPGPDGPRVQVVDEFATTVPGLLVLVDWLNEYQVKHVVMEATGDYWKPVWHLLEADFELMLVNARDVKLLLEQRQRPQRARPTMNTVWRYRACAPVRAALRRRRSRRSRACVIG